jgi:Family of unknown function (DUF6879)
MMDEAALVDWLNSAEHTVGRVQALDRYHVPSDDENYRRYLADEPGPVMGPIDAFHDWLEAEAARGVTWQQLLIVRSPLNSYWRYACEWGYALHTDHEAIRVFDVAEQSLPAAAPARLVRRDFYVADGRDVLLMHYDSQFRFVGASAPAESRQYREAFAAGWATAEGFQTWWNRHPEYRRGSRAA